MEVPSLLPAPPPSWAWGQPLYAHNSSGDTKGAQPPEIRQCVMSEANCGFSCGPWLSLPSGGREKGWGWGLGLVPRGGSEGLGLQRQPPPPRAGGRAEHSATESPSKVPKGHPAGTESILPPTYPRERRKEDPLHPTTPGLAWR